MQVNAVVELVNAAFRFYELLLIIMIIMSWVPTPRNPTVQTILKFVYDVTEPYLALFRKLLPTARMGGMGIDFSPMLGFIVIDIIRVMVVQIISQSI